ncbi:MAG: methylmalonyl Co-A mutase-associated GTPase MeaB [Rubrobacteraceae bacterium]|jgi:LAO/AO transport system kinase|nr:methylmalonyl Co-A mutase-associated GTPase MeaB [Actinomycetota bacterium]
MITRVESGADGADEQAAELYTAGGHAHIVGITGAPGAGKSTLLTSLVRELRARDNTIGIVAIDPSSPFSGGSILGDRIRMSELYHDPGVYIRSMATRGALGGLTRATTDAVAVLDAAGKDIILVETVGVGQDEVDIIRACHTTVVVSAPGMGDDVQAVKAGILEIADIHVVNKADRPEANKTIRDLKMMLKDTMQASVSGWNIPVLAASAEDGQGIDELVDTLECHHDHLVTSGEIEQRERDMAAHRLKTIIQNVALERIEDPSIGPDFDAAVEDVRLRKRAPFNVALGLIESGV